MDNDLVNAVARAFEAASERFSSAEILAASVAERFFVTDATKGNPTNLNSIAVSRHATRAERDAALLRVRMRAAIAAYETASAARIRELEEALKPFASEADTWPEDCLGDDDDLFIAQSDDGTAHKATFTFGDLRRARAVLEWKK